MNLRLSLAAAAALMGAAVFASPALAIEQVHIPDASAAQDSAPPDALFDKSVPTTWQNKQDQQQQSNGLGQFHFSAGAGNNPYADEQRAYTTGFQGENANAPGSEFHNNGVPLDPYYAPPPR
jgi:hypothetical protein